MIDEIEQSDTGSADLAIQAPNIRNTVKKLGGRPSKLTERAKAEILIQVRRGCYLETCFAYAGISRQTFSYWRKKSEVARESMQKGIPIRKRQRDLVKFFDDLEQALAQYEHIALHRIQRAGEQGNWQADAWRLERRFPERWAKKQEGDLNVNVAVGFGYIEVRENAPVDRSDSEALIPESRQLEPGDPIIDA